MVTEHDHSVLVAEINRAEVMRDIRRRARAGLSPSAVADLTAYVCEIAERQATAGFEAGYAAGYTRGARNAGNRR